MAKQKSVTQKPVINDTWSFPNLDSKFEKKQDLLFYISIGLLILFCICLFDVRIDEGGDDSDYLYTAKKFIEGKAFPGWHGAFYSILIGWCIKLFGFHLVLFKFFSMLFLVGHQVFLYLSLKNRISPFLLSIVLLIVSVNSGITYFGSQTYTEAFYMFLQSLFFYVFLKYIYDNPNNFEHLKKKWSAYLALGACIFMLATTRNVGVVALIVVVFCLLAEKKIIPAAASIIAYFILKTPYGIYKKAVWGVQTSEISGQLNEMMLKDSYNSALGKENFSGMITRIVENSKIYFSRVFMQEMGLKDSTNTDTNLFVPILIICILLFGFIMVYRNKKSVYRPIFVYLGMSLGATFIALNQKWGQARLIIIYIPLLIMAFTWTLAQIDKKWNFKIVRVIGIGLLALILLKSFMISAKKANDHQKILSKNLKGDMYYGYTPDWINFLKVSEIASKKVPEDILIASRKASMSFIYGKGHDFFPITKIPVMPSDTILVQANASGKVIYYINENSLNKKNAQIVMATRPKLYGVIFAEEMLYGVYLVDPKEKDNFDAFLKMNQIETLYTAEDFKSKVLAKSKNITGVVPDNLLNNLKKNNVHYIILASLRINPNQKTDRTINTVERYAGLIELKYPGIFSLVHQEGSEQNEPAKLIKIEYERYGIK